MTAGRLNLVPHAPPSTPSSQVNILDKSKMDWDKMKGTDTQAQEELELHKRSSNKYLDKVRALGGCNSHTTRACVQPYGMCVALSCRWRRQVMVYSSTLCFM